MKNNKNNQMKVFLTMVFLTQISHWYGQSNNLNLHSDKPFRVWAKALV
jgi:hypothetical protein